MPLCIIILFLCLFHFCTFFTSLVFCLSLSISLCFLWLSNSSSFPYVFLFALLWSITEKESCCKRICLLSGKSPFPATSCTSTICTKVSHFPQEHHWAVSYRIQHQHLFTSHPSRSTAVRLNTSSLLIESQTALLHKHILMLDLLYNSVSKSVLALLSFHLITTDPKASRTVRTGHFESAPTCCVLRHLPRIRLMAWEPKRGIVFTNCRVFQVICYNVRDCFE